MSYDPDMVRRLLSKKGGLSMRMPPNALPVAPVPKKSRRKGGFFNALFGIGSAAARAATVGSTAARAATVGTTAARAATASTTAARAATASTTAAQAATASTTAARAATASTAAARASTASTAAANAARTGTSAATAARTGSSAAAASSAAASTGTAATTAASAGTAATTAAAAGTAATTAATLGSRAMAAANLAALGLGIAFPVYGIVAGEQQAKRDAALLAAQQEQDRIDRADAAARQKIADDLQRKYDADYEADRLKLKKEEEDAKKRAADDAKIAAENARLQKIEDEKAYADYLAQQDLLLAQAAEAEARQLAAIERAIQESMSRSSAPFTYPQIPANIPTPTSVRPSPVVPIVPVAPAPSYVPPAAPPAAPPAYYVPPAPAPAPRGRSKGGSMKSLRAELKNLGYRL